MSLTASKKLGPVLRALRQQRELSLRELARRAGVSPTYLSRVETGQERNPTEAMLCSLSKELGCESDELLQLAGRVPEDVRLILLSQPGYFDFVREVHKRRREAPSLLALLKPRKAK